MAPIVFGALAYDYQVIDVIGITDLINSGSKLILGAIKEYAPVADQTLADAPDCVFHHIGLSREPVPLLSSQLTIVPTATVDDDLEIDVLVLGGPNPSDFVLHPRYAEYIRRHVAAGKVVFTNCTGSFVAAQAGVLDGRTATVNHIEFEWIKKRYPKVNWVLEQWVVDGNIWTGSGAVAGMDMAAHWIKEKYGEKVMTAAALGLDFEPRDINASLTVLPKRYDANGKQTSAHLYEWYDKY